MLLASTVTAMTSRAENDRRRWGRMVPVVVTARALPPGAELRGAVRVVQFPAAVAPADAISDIADLPAGSTVRTARSAGEPVTRAWLSSTSTSDRPLVAVPTPGPRPRLSAGDQVSIWATYDPSLAGTEPTTKKVADHAAVATSSEDAVVVEVDEERLEEVVEATALATITLVSEPR